MSSPDAPSPSFSRRAFLQHGGCFFASTLFAGSAESAPSVGDGNRAKWRQRIGLILGTIRPEIAKLDTLEAAFARIEKMGVREVETTLNYDFLGLSPKQFRALLDRYKLTMPVTHAVASEGPNLEKTLEGFQIMGLKYARIGGEGVAGAVAELRRDAPAAPTSGRSEPKREKALNLPTVDAVKRSAAQNNKRGRLLKKFGMKNYVHNHTAEFELLGIGTLNRHEIMVTESDPELVTMQLDIGWASVAGQNIVDLFQRHPGRYELWHVKDATGLKTMNPALTPTQRQRVATLCPVGEGDVDYRTIFGYTELAGLKHFSIEQDNASRDGQHMRAVQISVQNLLTKVLV